MAKRKNIKILGAGISGLTAAINLAKAGYGVVVYEKNKDCGMRFHGDMQGLENWSNEEDVLDMMHSMHIDINFDATPFRKVQFSNCESTKEFSYDKPLFYLVKRGSQKGSLDMGLKKQSQDCGVVIKFEQEVEEKECDIVATGPKFKHIIIADKGELFKNDLPDMAIAIVNNEAAYKGYSYFLNVDGHGCLCSCVFDDIKKLNECYDFTKKYFISKYNIKILKSKEVGGVGYFSLKNCYRKGKALYVGESAGIQDFLAGFGMRTAMKSGFLAAQSILNNTDYEKMAEEEFGDYLRAGIVNRFVWEHSDSDNYLSVLERLNKMDNSTKYLKSIYNYNLIEHIEYPIALSYIKKQYPEILE